MNKAEQDAAAFAEEVQDACNLYAIVGYFYDHLGEMRKTGIVGDRLNNHPVVLTIISKLISLSRFDNEREWKAFEAIRNMAAGQPTEYETIPLE